MSHARTSDFISFLPLVPERQTQNNSRNLATHQFHSLAANNKQVIVKHHLPTAKTNTYSLCRNSGGKSRRILDLLVVFFILLGNETLCSNSDAASRENINFMYPLLKNKPAPLQGLTCLQCPAACEICARVIHHSRSSEVVGNPCRDSIWTFYYACNILKPSGFEQTTYFVTLFMTLVSDSYTRTAL